MSGPTTPDLAYNDPLAVDVVARTFPKLPIVCCHGFYPRVADILTVAFRNENVFVSPDMYMFSPGGRLYIEAANGFLQDQIPVRHLLSVPRHGAERGGSEGDRPRRRGSREGHEDEPTAPTRSRLGCRMSADPLLRRRRRRRRPHRLRLPPSRPTQRIAT